MKQFNLLAEDNRLNRLSDMGDPLEKIAKVINWEVFRPLLDKAFRIEPKAPGGRPPFDRVMMFKIVMLQQWYHIADDATEYTINDRLSFQRFLGLSLGDKVPDAKTIWLFKENIKTNDSDRRLFELFGELLTEAGVITREGSIVDASFIDVPRQRNKRSENESIKAGNVPEEWRKEENVSKLRQKDTDARWAKKDNETHYGYKDHIKADRDSKLIVDFEVTPASVHDSQRFEPLIDKSDKVVWADSGYVGQEIRDAILHNVPTVQLIINEKGSKNAPLTGEQKASNREKSRTRVRVEHVFGHMTNSMGGMFIRCIGIDRAVRDITFKNLAYNLSRFATLVGLNRAVAMA